MAKVLHLTPHMGGGVGKVLSGLVEAAQNTSPHKHDILCLERPEKDLFVKKAEAAGGRVIIEEDITRLPEHLNDAGIVQVEFWNHPAITAALCSQPWPAVRPIFWSHISGLHAPALPKGLFDQAAHWVLTSGCSFEGETVATWRTKRPDDISVISSAGGLKVLPEPIRKPDDRPLKLGYVGTLNFSKLHPDMVTFLSAMPDDLQPLHLYGDVLNKAVLTDACDRAGKPSLLSFEGFQSDIASVLADLDVLVYLLNPFHYGTAENALVEAMAAGVVPIVLNNPCEHHIVQDGVTGFVIDDGIELAQSLAELNGDRNRLWAMTQQSARHAREVYSYAAMSRSFDGLYNRVLGGPKVTPDFLGAFGSSPAEWFLAFQPDHTPFNRDGSVDIPAGLDRYALFERTKGSVFHFLKSDPDDALLKAWGDHLQSQMPG